MTATKNTVAKVAARALRTIANNGEMNVTQKLFAMYDLFGNGALTVAIARDTAEKYGLNRTSAGIAFYRWQKAAKAAAKRAARANRKAAV